MALSLQNVNIDNADWLRLSVVDSDHLPFWTALGG